MNNSIKGGDILSLRKKKGLTQRQLSEQSGIPLGTISRIESLRNDEIKKVEVLTSLMNVLKDDVNLKNDNADSAPYFANINVSAGFSFITNNSNQHPDTFIKIPGLKVDAYINVFGDSMVPRFRSGQIIGVKTMIKEMVVFGFPYVIEMVDDETYIKYIQPGKDKDHWSLESENPHFKPTEFHVSKVRRVFKIKSVLTRESL